ncbi:MAG: hypothetical protein JOZ00_02080 [Mycobacterium sp.]|uniref:hypothetical protein n=1 Tax=Mycobacterium sp. TaxID=1785 RepID=UPI001EBF3A0B|nr:hypothetical protein [Mycobacterium sp.]MBV8785460.1 hypothetical protein [Mycobacterium sp.]
MVVLAMFAGLLTPMAFAGGPPPTVGVALSPEGGGWTVQSNGAVSAWGGAANLGDLTGVSLSHPVVGIASTPSGDGYWLVASDGGVFSFGDARFHGSTGRTRLSKPVVGITSTPSGRGYWLVASDGGVFSFGDARFYGSTARMQLNLPIVGMANDGGAGYWLVARDGGVFAFGDAPFFGSTGAVPGEGSVVGMSVAPGATGYVVANSSGNVYPFGTGVSAPPPPPVAPVTTETTVTTAPPPPTTAPTSSTTAPPAPVSPAATAPVVSLAHYFLASSPFNQPVSGAPVPGTGQVAAELGSGPAADIYQYGTPIYSDVNASTPRYSVSCTENWGVCPLSRQPVPIPADATPTSGSDAEMVIVDPSTNLAYEFWQAQRSGNSWVASWGAVVSTVGPGNVDIYGGPGGTGSGLSQLVGVATMAELGAGNIPHALAFSSSLTCSTYVAPAVKSDGHGSPPNCIPEGGRIQLDPSINLAAIPGITPFELAVGRALQVYGAFCRDSGGASLALSFETPHPGAADPYPALGVSADYYNMPHLPWQSLRVVSS